MAEARLTVTVDTAPGEELARRITAALEASLATVRAEGVTDDETYLSLATDAVLHEVLRVRTDAGPREHCGHLSPQTLLSTPPVECVLRPGHSGSHADDRGCRWMTAPAPAQSERPGCPDCGMPHDLDPGSLPMAACANIRAGIAAEDATATSAPAPPAGTLREQLAAIEYALLPLMARGDLRAQGAAIERLRKLAEELAHPRHMGKHGLPHRLVADEIRAALDPQEQRATPHDGVSPEGS
ncbi:hypothetical protein ACIOWI_29575 [Streptomyces sp. NPDC087659]|uniref:hypothetical protein n=1 Tax=Streptomyces sp. NPDC087659 TaxID=3365801 RepID=UPI0038109C43